MATINVATDAQLVAALAKAKGGDVIALAQGTYSLLKVNNMNFSSAITITSADASKPATISGLSMNNSSNVTYKDLSIGRVIKTTEPEFTQIANVNKSSNVVFDSVTFHGTDTKTPADMRGWGLFLRDSNNLTVKNTTFQDLALGLNVSNANNVKIVDNDFHDMRRDGVNLSAITNGVIENNSFTDFYPVNGEHPDAIQFFTAGTTKASSNIQIRNNVVLQGAGEAIQGIFMNDEVGTLPYEKVTIENNLVYINGMTNGISVQGGKDITVRSNTVLSRTDDNMRAWIRLQKVDGAVLEKNVADTSLIDSTSRNIVQNDNIFLAQNAAAVRNFGNLMDVSSVTIGDLVMADAGYQPPARTVSASAAMTSQARAASEAGDLLLDLSFDRNGITDQSAYNSAALSPIDASKISLSGGQGFYNLATSNDAYYLSQNNSWQIYGLEEFTLSFAMKRGSTTSGTGQIMSILNGWTVRLENNGELSFSVTGQNGAAQTVSTTGARLTDLATHKIDIAFDGDAGKATIFVDGAAKGSGAVPSSTKNLESWGLVLGNRFGATFVGGLGDISITEGRTATAGPRAASGITVYADDPTPASLLPATLAEAPTVKSAFSSEAPLTAADLVLSSSALQPWGSEYLFHA